MERATPVSRSRAPASASSSASSRPSSSNGIRGFLVQHLERAVCGVQNLANNSPEVQSIRKASNETGQNAADTKEIPWRELYKVDWTPKELCVKFRQQMEGYQLGANFEVVRYEFDGIPEHGCNTKIVFKPVGREPRWKIIFEPKQGDLRFLTRKIPMGPLLGFQVGLGHDFHSGRTGWKWRITSTFGDVWPAPQLRQKSILPVCPGFDIRIGWNAEYVLPDVHGSVGIGEPAVGLDLGHLRASLNRVEAVFTHVT